MHAALLGALAVARVDRLAGLHLRDDLALTGNDDEEHVGAHRRGHHRAHQQEGGAPGKPLTGQPSSEDDEQSHHQADDPVAMAALAEAAADQVVDEPEDDEKGDRGGDRGAAAPRVHALVDEVDIGLEQVQHGEQRKAGQPGPVALPVEPVQVPGDARRRHHVLLRVVEAPGVQGPQFAGAALGLQLRAGRRQAVVEKDEIKRGADPGDGDDDVRPAQQQIDPIENIGVHAGALPCVPAANRCIPLPRRAL